MEHAVGSYRELLLTSHSPFLQLQLAGAVDECNEQLTSLVGLGREQLLSQPLASVAAEGGAELQRALEGACGGQCSEGVLLSFDKVR